MRGLWIAALFSVGALCGCGAKGGLPAGETGTVHGKITFQGMPVPEGCQVLFIESKSGILGTATTGAGGDYTLSMRGDGKILVGSYRVAISPPKPNSGLSDEEISRLGMENKLPKAVPVKEVPELYRSPETTPEKADVKPGDNSINVDMKGK